MKKAKIEKKYHNYELEIGITYICPNTMTRVQVNLADTYAIEAGESECELCGSHGDISINVEQCPECHKKHDIEVRSW